jgi:peptide/nickel transport system substrate-binding protein
MMRFRLRTSALLGLIFAACSYQAPKDPETLVWHLGAEPDTLNPLTSTDAYASRIQGFLYDSLIERDNQTLEWKPKMAERWEISPDRRHFTFYLRDGIRWQDGRPVTVEDILYSFERIMDPKVDAPHLRVYYQDIEKVEKVDERTVRFTYKRPYFMAFEFCGGIPIIPRHLFDNGEDFNRHLQGRAPVGNGPYRFVSWETGQKIVIERNEDYWGKAIGKMPDIKRISFEVIAEDTVALQILKKGGLDFAGLRPIQWVRQTDSERFNRRFAKYEFYTPGYSFIAWNMRRPYFSDRRVRRAMTMLVNREAILQKLNFGLGRIVTGPFYIESKDYNREIRPIPYDPEGAKKLLKEAGWEDRDGDGILDREGQPFRFQFLISSGRRFAERLATILKEDLKTVGIEMEIRQLEWALFTKQLEDRTFDAVTLGWVFGLEQDPYQVWHSSQTERGSNFVGFADDEADRIILEGRKEFDRERRARLYRKFHAIVDEEQPYTFLFSNPYLVALHRRFENVKVYPAGMDPIEWKVARITDE